MLRNIKDLEHYAIQATDGHIGHVSDFYFDDNSWVVRYLIVNTGGWFSNRTVLISPISIGNSSQDEKVLVVSLTKEKIKNSPDIDTNKPVSRQYEVGFLGYYGYPHYWNGGGLWGVGAFPNLMLTGIAESNALEECDKRIVERTRDISELESSQASDPHLRSCNEVMGYHFEATDGDIGHVKGFLVEEETWAIRYIIVETSNWWLGHQVLIVPQWISNVNWFDNTVSVELTRQAVKDAPPYDSTVHLDREWEEGIYKHYDRHGYWTNQLCQ